MNFDQHEKQANHAKVIIHKFVPCYPIWRMNRTLAPTFNMLYHPIAQTDSYTLDINPVTKTVEVVFPPQCPPLTNHQSLSRRKNVMPTNSVTQRIKSKFRLPLLCLDAKLAPQPEARFGLRKKPGHLKSRQQLEVNSFHSGLSRQTALSLRYTRITPLHHYGSLRLPPPRLLFFCIPLTPSGEAPQVKGPPWSQTAPSPCAVNVNPPWESCRCKRWFLHGTCRLHHFRRAGHSHRTYGVKLSSFALRFMDSSITAQFPTDPTNNLSCKLLSAYKISQTSLGAANIFQYVLIKNKEDRYANLKT